MARPIQIKPEAILAAARDVFLERGIRATTAEVASRAGVSEGSVFKRFHSKFELFRAAMGELLEEPTFLRDLSKKVAKGDLERNLNKLGVEIIEYFRSIMPLIMMSWSNPARDGLPSLLAGADPPPLRAIRKLASYFDAEMTAGRMRRTNADLVARAFLGGLNHYAFTEVLLRERGGPPLSPAAYVRGFVQLMFKGLDV
ncbi:MAG TPA: TetR/AcrR family transcriptional regulator [Byssovorax sp.]|jgi:AcrR family transcriptional regulator